MEYEVDYAGKQSSFTTELIEGLNISDDALYQVISLEGDRSSPSRVKRYSPGNGLVSLIAGLRNQRGDVTIRGPVDSEKKDDKTVD